MTHRLTNTRLYSIFKNMKQRCYNPNNPKYSSYGGRGITICDEWLHDFQTFYDWAIKNGYSDDLTIDRKENNKGYSPDNCQWITMKENRKKSSAGRPPLQETSRKEDLNIRLTKQEKEDIQYCAEKLKVSRTDAIIKGILLLKEEMKKE